MSTTDQTIRFQAITWAESHELSADEERGIADPLAVVIDTLLRKGGNYVIECFGRTRDGRPVHLTIHDFKPWIHVLVQPYLTFDVNTLEQYLQWNINGKERSSTPLVASASIVQMVDGSEFTNGKPCDMHRIAFSNTNALSSARQFLRDRGHVLFDGQIPAINKFFHWTGLKPCGWIEISHTSPAPSAGRISLSCSTRQLRPVDSPVNANFILGAFDIECCPKADNFPNPDRPHDRIIQIGVALATINDPTIFRSIVVVVGECTPSSLAQQEKGRHIISVKNETECILTFAQILAEEDVDILTGYNIFDFDWYFILSRANRHGIYFELMRTLSRGRAAAKPHVRDLSNAGKGRNHFHYPMMPGRVSMDVLLKVRWDTRKLPSYKLEDVAQHFLGHGKDDLPARELFALYRKGEPSGLRKIAEYCRKDVELCIELITHGSLDYIRSDIEMANLCQVRIDELQNGSENTKATSLIGFYAAQKGLAWKEKTERAKDEQEESAGTKKKVQYQGALVVDPKPADKGRNMTVGVWDFASLYPSQIMAYNLCPTTLIHNSLYHSVPHEVHVYADKDGANPKEVRVVKVDAANPWTKGLVPHLLESLIAARKAYKKEMERQEEAHIRLKMEKSDRERRNETIDNEFLSLLHEASSRVSMLNNKQMVTKIVTNAIYGLLGSKFSIISSIDCAAVTTKLGRDRLGDTIKHMETNYPTCPVIYGDSMPPWTPVLVRRPDGRIEVVPIDSVGARFSPTSDGKEAALPHTHVHIWSDHGWTPIRCIVRHRGVHELFEVQMPHGNVTVTDGHSLFDRRGTVVTARSLLTAPTPLLTVSLRTLVKGTTMSNTRGSPKTVEGE